MPQLTVGFLLFPGFEVTHSNCRNYIEQSRALIFCFWTCRMKIQCLLAFLQCLDVYGPLEMFGCKPMRAHFNVTFLAERKGPVPSAQEAITLAEHDFSSCPKLDILVVPGTRALDSPCYLGACA